MAEKFKSKDDVLRLATAVQERRLALGLTLKNIEDLQKINCGQLSRIEAGKFTTNSPNLQKLCKFLQIPVERPRKLGDRLEQFAKRSAQHRAAAEDLLTALERLI